MSKKTKIEVKYDYIQLDVTEANLGALDTSSVQTGQENGVIVALGPEVKDKTLKVGDRILFATWALEFNLYESVQYRFLKEDRQGIIAKVK